MKKFAKPEEQIFTKPTASPAFMALGLDGDPGVMAAATRRTRTKSSHQIWTRADGFTLSGPRRA
jgi:hypothetical protein